MERPLLGSPAGSCWLRRLAHVGFTGWLLLGSPAGRKGWPI